MATAKRELEKFAYNFAHSKNSNLRTVNENWTLLKTTIDNVVNKFVPSTTTTSRYNVSWLYRKLKNVIDKKNKQFTKAILTNTPRDCNKYRQLKHLCQKKLCSAHSQNIGDTLKSSFENKDSKKFWNYVKSKKTNNIGVYNP